jgi:hypothetical protein
MKAFFRRLLGSEHVDPLSGAAPRPRAEEHVSVADLVAESQRLGLEVDALRARRREIRVLIDQLLAEEARGLPPPTSGGVFSVKD